MSSTETVKLLPCPNPWCEEDRRPIIVWDLHSKRVICPCGVRGPRSQTKANTTQNVPINDESARIAQSEAITAWNNRPASQPKCRKCNGTMSPGKAIAQTMRGIGDFHDADEVSTISAGGPGALIDCMKCEDCGWSVTGDAVAEENTNAG